MRWSRFYLFTTREVPNDAEVVSHRLMVRAGMIKKVAAGIYSTLPLGTRSFARLEAIVRRELDVAGSVELAMPAVQPAKLWKESGRWQEYGRELLRMHDRHDREFCLGPTHEEIITDIVRRDLRSWRHLPVNLYQIQNKFRDEIRPRFGLMRGREFLMKDAYSFHATDSCLDETYQAMNAAYSRIFEACQLDYTVVEADTGTIGGSSSHEFMVLADTGESVVVRCPDCGYAANDEKAGAAKLEAPEGVAPEALASVDTPELKTVAKVAQFLEVPESRLIKTLLYVTEKGPVAALVRGDREINEVKLGNLLDVLELRMARDDEVEKLTGSPVGFAGPVGLSDEVRIVADSSAAELAHFVCGANRGDTHLAGVVWGRDVEVPEVADLLLVGQGDRCPRCSTEMLATRGIEVGHIFKLGTKYSRAMKCNFQNEEGQDHPMTMGCYGLGIGRTIAAAIEQNHDEDGIIWPIPLAPFEVLVIALNPDDEEVGKAADRLYDELREAGVDVLYDDRGGRPGVKFKDADLIGVPIRIVVGARALAEGEMEISLRREGRQKHRVAVADAKARALSMLRGE